MLRGNTCDGQTSREFHVCIHMYIHNSDLVNSVPESNGGAYATYAHE